MIFLFSSYKTEIFCFKIYFTTFYASREAIRTPSPSLLGSAWLSSKTIYLTKSRPLKQEWRWRGSRFSGESRVPLSRRRGEIKVQVKIVQAERGDGVGIKILYSRNVTLFLKLLLFITLFITFIYNFYF